MLASYTTCSKISMAGVALDVFTNKSKFTNPVYIKPYITPDIQYKETSPLTYVLSQVK